MGLYTLCAHLLLWQCSFIMNFIVEKGVFLVVCLLFHPSAWAPSKKVPSCLIIKEDEQ